MFNKIVYLYFLCLLQKTENSRIFHKKAQLSLFTFFHKVLFLFVLCAFLFYSTLLITPISMNVYNCTCLKLPCIHTIHIHGMTHPQNWYRTWIKKNILNARLATLQSHAEHQTMIKKMVKKIVCMKYKI